MLGLSAFWTTVVKVELTDIVFAIDSILVAVAMSSKTWVILTGGILGIITMRLVIGQLLAIVERYPRARGRRVHHHRRGSAVKLLLEYLHAEGYVHFEVPKWLSLGPHRRDLRRVVALRDARGRSTARHAEAARRTMATDALEGRLTA